jgi:hypothetical protein
MILPGVLLATWAEQHLAQPTGPIWIASYKMTRYKYTNSTQTAVRDTDTDATIPLVEGNRHAAEVRQWEAAGGVIDPADPEPEPSQMPSDTERIAALESIIATLL